VLGVVGVALNHSVVKIIIMWIALGIFVLCGVYVAVSLGHRVHVASLILRFVQSAYFRDYHLTAVDNESAFKKLAWQAIFGRRCSQDEQ